MPTEREGGYDYFLELVSNVGLSVFLVVGFFLFCWFKGWPILAKLAQSHIDLVQDMREGHQQVREDLHTIAAEIRRGLEDRRR